MVDPAEVEIFQQELYRKVLIFKNPKVINILNPLRQPRGFRQCRAPSWLLVSHLLSYKRSFYIYQGQNLKGPLAPLATQAPPVLYLLQSAITAMKIDINSGPSPHYIKQVGVSQETKTSLFTALPEPNSLLHCIKVINFSNKTPN